MWVIVINNVVLVLLFIINWDHDDVLVILYQYWSSMVLFCVWYWFYMDRELPYIFVILVLFDSTATGACVLCVVLTGSVDIRKIQEFQETFGY